MNTTGTLLYSRETERRPYAYSYSRSDEQRAKTPHQPLDVDSERVAVDVSITDARQLRMTLDANGFQLVDHSTRLQTEDFYKGVEFVESAYYPEMAALVKSTTGAAHVHMFHHEIRNSAKAQPANAFSHSTSTIKGYLPYVHSDSHARHAQEQFQKFAYMHAEAREFSKGRFVFFTAWRNIDGTNPVHDHPLAVCDERSLVKPDDYICSDLHFEHESKQLYHLNESNHKRHRWYYYPQMRQDEVLIFKNWDSDRDQPARIVFHTAFSDPRAPADAPGRQSCEARGYAYFPDHEPDTCSFLVTPYANVSVEEATSRCLAAVEVLEQWPLEGQQYIIVAAGRGAIEEIAAVLANDSGNKLGLEKMDPLEKKKTAAVLVQGKLADVVHTQVTRCCNRQRRTSWADLEMTRKTSIKSSGCPVHIQVSNTMLALTAGFAIGGILVHLMHARR